MTMITNSSSVPHLLIGHGAGSFGHVPAKKYGTRQGVHTPQEWLGFAEVWKEAAALNRLTTDALLAAGLPVVSFSPCASVTARDGKVEVWELYPIRSALEAGLVPLVFGDVIFDRQRGGSSRVDLQACKLGTGRRFTTS
jgi:Predicted archaeal kinase